jgi:excisionase family DNA binding protein
MENTFPYGGPGDMVSLKEFAYIFQLSLPAVSVMAKSGRIPAYKIGGRYRISLKEAAEQGKKNAVTQKPNPQKL